MDKSLAEAVWRRARHRCEYCHLPSQYAQRPFQIDHIIAEQHGGLTRLDNLALACLSCNVHKGPNIAGLNPQTQRVTRLFNPRKDSWRRHFRWEGAHLVGLTSCGRATINVLAINDWLAVATRERLIAARAFPDLESA
jgi:hypothetical protein